MSVFKQVFDKIAKKKGIKAIIWELHKITGFSADRLSKVAKSAETVAPDLVGKVGQIYEDSGTGSAREYLDILANSKVAAKKKK